MRVFYPISLSLPRLGKRERDIGHVCSYSYLSRRERDKNTLDTWVRTGYSLSSREYPYSLQRKREKESPFRGFPKREKERLASFHSPWFPLLAREIIGIHSSFHWAVASQKALDLLLLEQICGGAFCLCQQHSCSISLVNKGNVGVYNRPSRYHNKPFRACCS